MAIATGTALLIAGLGGAIGSAASSIHGTRAAADVNRRSVDAQRTSEAEAFAEQRATRESQAQLEREQREEAARLEREARAETARRESELLAFERQRESDRISAAERARQDALAFEQSRWSEYVNASRPYWQVGNMAMSNLLGLMGGAAAGQPMQPGAGVPGAPSTAAPAMRATPAVSPRTRAITLDDLASRAATGAPTRAMRPRPRMSMPIQTPQMSLMDLARMAAGRPGSATAGP